MATSNCMENMIPEKFLFSSILSCRKKNHNKIPNRNPAKPAKMLDFIDLHQFSLILLVFTRYAPAPIFKMSTKNMSRINLVHFFFLWPHQIVWRTRFQKSFCFRAFYRIEKNCTTNLKFSTWNTLEIHAPGLWRHFISRIPSNYSTKLSKILDFSEMPLSSRPRNFS